MKKYRVLNFNMAGVTGWHKTLDNAISKCIETMPQYKVWFIQADSGEIACIVHCDSAWYPKEESEAK